MPLRLGGLFGGEVAACVEAVDADVEERAAAGEGLFGAPVAGIDVEAEGSFDGLDLAERAVVNELGGLEVGGLEVAAVGDHELDVGGFAGGDHGFALGNAGGHWLLAEDVLAGLGGADGEVGVHGVGQGYVNGIDGGVVEDVVEVFVVVDGVGRYAVLGGDAIGLVAMAADQGGDFGVGGVLDAAHEDAGDAAQADDGVADFAAWVLCAESGREASGECESTETCEFSASKRHGDKSFLG